MKKFIVITSIFNPTEAIEGFSRYKDWQLVVVGDKKTPKNWQKDGVIYLSPEDQQNLGFEIADLLPWNHYGRKMIGYLYAIKNGAEVIADSDDDNIPHPGWGESIFEPTISQLSQDTDYVNIYNHFTDQKVWPRGLPLKHINTPSSYKIEDPTKQKVGVWQYLADEDPDVDAIYRLTSDETVVFNRSQPVVVKEGVLSPYNSQNTIHRKEVFNLLYLPAFVTFRFTDILRGYVAQHSMWEYGFKLAFGPATVTQKRNPHDYTKDFESEIPMYLYVEQVNEIAKNIASKSSKENILVDVYKALKDEGIVREEEIALLEAWVRDLNRVGWHI